MNYVISDLHGCMDKYRELLEKIHFSPEDTLYFLGDVLDRGPSSASILLDMSSCSNVKAILGSHEAMAIQALPAIRKCTAYGRNALTQDEADAVNIWLGNHGTPSILNLILMGKAQRQKVWDYMNSLPLYREVTVGHTPTQLMYAKLGVCTGKAEFFRTESLIDIDCGCVFEGRLGCLCLDTMEKLYI